MLPQILTEDDIYRSSTQYRFWSFTPEALASLRETNCKTAAQQVAAAQDAHTNVASAANDDSSFTLTAEEELTLLNHHTHALLRIGLKKLNLPTPVAATGAVYLRRFYLSNSPLYHPFHAIMPTCLFLATKTEHYYVPLSTFTDKWPSELEPADVIREEGTVTQALRFCLDVRHPFRGLRGALMELRAIADGSASVPPAAATTSGSAPRTAQTIQEELLALRPPDLDDDDDAAEAQQQRDAESAKPPVRRAQDRAFQAHDAARALLASSALLSDAYFLYTPAQLMFGALQCADAPLARFYLRTKLPLPPGASDADADAAAATEAGPSAFADKVHAAVRECAALLGGVQAAVEAQEAEAVRAERKLDKCRAALAAAAAKKAKREGGERGDGVEMGLQSAKKRKLEALGEGGGERRSKSPFGGPLDGGKGT